jgi:hypothetical protein
MRFEDLRIPFADRPRRQLYEASEDIDADAEVRREQHWSARGGRVEFGELVVTEAGRSRDEWHLVAYAPAKGSERCCGRREIDDDIDRFLGVIERGDVAVVMGLFWSHDSIRYAENAGSGIFDRATHPTVGTNDC